MTDSRTLTLATLRQKGACSDQCALFKKIFGDSVEVTEALAAEHAGKFDVVWAVRLLSPPARAACVAAVAQARAAYYAAVAPAQDAYVAAREKAQAAYDEAVAEARAAYDAAKAQAWAAYRAATAQAWARAYINDK